MLAEICIPLSHVSFLLTRIICTHMILICLCQVSFTYTSVLARFCHQRMYNQNRKQTERTESPCFTGFAENLSPPCRETDERQLLWSEPSRCVKIRQALITWSCVEAISELIFNRTCCLIDSNFKTVCMKKLVPLNEVLVVLIEHNTLKRTGNHPENLWY